MASLVKDFMTKKREIVSPEDSVESAIEVMVENDAGSVIVEDENQKVIGMFTERDLLRHYLDKQTKFLYLKVGEVMSSPVETVTKDIRISEALQLMNNNKIRRLPVVDGNGRMVGFLSWKELFVNFFKQLEEMEKR